MSTAGGRGASATYLCLSLPLMMVACYTRVQRWLYTVPVTSEVEPLVRRGTGDGRRTALLALRVKPESLAAIDALAKKRGWSRADTVRSLLRAGLEVESRQ